MKDSLMQDVANTLAYGIRSIEASLAEADAAMKRVEISRKLEAAQDWVELARHYSVSPTNKDKFIIARVREQKQGVLGAFTYIAINTKASARAAFAFAADAEADFVARNGVILMQRKDAPVKPPTPALSPRLLQAIQRAQRMIGGAA